MGFAREYMWAKLGGRPPDTYWRKVLASGKPMTGEIASFEARKAAPLRSLTAEIRPVQSGSGDPSPDNIRPISGWTGAKVMRCGANMCMVQPQIGSGARYVVLDGYTKAYDNLIITLHATDLTFENNTGAQGAIYHNNVRVKYFLFGKTYKQDGTSFVKNGDPYTGIMYIELGPLEEGYNRVDLYSDSVSYNQWQGRIDWCVISVTDNTVAPAFEPYQSAAWEIAFPTEAGTVCGGTLDVTNGVLTVTHVLWTANTADMNNSEIYPGWRDAGVKALLGPGINTAQSNQTMNIGTVFAANTLGGQDILYFPISYYDRRTQTEWQALALDVQIVIRLAEPVTYRLTPTEVRTLAGENNVWADCGEIAIEYIKQKEDNA